MFENRNLNLMNLCSVFMQVKPPCSFTSQEVDYLTDRIQNGGTEVVEVKHFLATLESSFHLEDESAPDSTL